MTFDRHSPAVGAPKLKPEFVKEIRSLNKQFGDEVISFIGDSEKLQSLFKPQTLNRAIKHYPRGSIDILPGLMSLHPEALANQREIRDLCNKELPPQVDGFGRVTGNGIRADFNGLLHLGGLPQEKATTPFFDNRPERLKKGLVNTWQSEFDRNLFRGFVHCFFKKLPTVKTKLKDRSSSGFDDFNTDVVEKVIKFNGYMDNLDSIIGLLMNDDLETGYQLHGCFGPSFTLFRDQTGDKVSEQDDGELIAKERLIAPPAFAVSGGTLGQMEQSSKDPAVWGLHNLSGKFFLQRRRVAYGQSAGYSFFLLPWAQSIRAHVYDEYAFTMHHSTPEQKREKMAAWASQIAADVSDHDLYWPVDLYEPEISHVLRELGYEAWAIKMFRNALRTAIYVPTIGVGEGGFMIGDWTNPNNSSGLVSGNPFTDILGSVGMVFVYALTQLENTAPDIIARLSSKRQEEITAWCDAYLQGRLDIAAPSKSDDAYLLWRNDLSLIERSKKFHQKLKDAADGKIEFQANKYMIITYEHGGAFLGDICLYPGDYSAKDIRFIGNGNNYPLRKFIPEYPLKQSPDYGLLENDRLKMLNRAYGGLAYAGQLQKYGSMPSFEAITDVIRFSWKKHLQDKMGGPYEAYMESYLKHDTERMQHDIKRRLKRQVERGLVSPRVLSGALTSIETEYVNDPSIVTWKYKDNEVDESLQDLHFGSISLETTGKYLDKINKRIRV